MAKSIAHNYLLSITIHKKRSPPRAYRRSGRRPSRRDAFRKRFLKEVRVFSPWVAILFSPWHVRETSINRFHRVISIICSICFCIEPSAIFSIIWLILVVRNNRSSDSLLLNRLIRQSRKAICIRFGRSNGVEESSSIMTINRWHHILRFLSSRSPWSENWSSTGKRRWRNVSMLRPWSFCSIHLGSMWSSDRMPDFFRPIKSTVVNWFGRFKRRIGSKAVQHSRAMDTTFSSVKIVLLSIEEKTTIDLGDYSGMLYVVDVADGSLFSSYQCDGLIKSVPCVHASLDIVYVGAHDQFLHAIQLQATSTCLWKYGLNSSCVSSPQLSTDNQRLFVGSLNGDVLALQADNGQLLWKSALQKPIFSSLAIWNEKFLIVGCVDQNLYCLDSDTGIQVESFSHEPSETHWHDLEMDVLHHCSDLLFALFIPEQFVRWLSRSISLCSGSVPRARCSPPLEMSLPIDDLCISVRSRQRSMGSGRFYRWLSTHLGDWNRKFRLWNTNG